MAGELLEFPNDVVGMVLNLEEDNVGAAIFGPDTQIKEGDSVKRSGKIVSVPVGDAMLGRVVDGLGNPIDGKGPIATDTVAPVEIKAPGIVKRKSVHEPLQTGLKAIDSMIPIGRGQRELIIGDRQTGKTAVAIDAIINQKVFKDDPKRRALHLRGHRQKQSTVAQVVRKLKKQAPWSTPLWSPSASQPAHAVLGSIHRLHHYEYYRDNGQLCLRRPLKQANAYRQLSRPASSTGTRNTQVTCSTFTRASSSVPPRCPTVTAVAP